MLNPAVSGQETKGGAGESTETRKSSATQGVEAEREGEADKKEVRAGPRGERSDQIRSDRFEPPQPPREESG